MRLIWQFVAVAVVALLGSLAAAAVQGNPWLTLGVGVSTAAFAILVYGWVVRRTERRAPTEVAVQGAVSAVGRGTLIGVALFSLVIASIVTLGGYTIHGLGTPTGAVGLLGVMTAVAVTEELMFRGVLFRIVEERAGTWIALALTGVLFGLIHLVNPNASLWGAVAIAIEAGGMLTAAYVATRRLWVPIGLHLGWNVAASAVFSTEVSGNNTPQGLLDATTSGPALLTGGAFGPEGSVFSLVFCVLAAAVFMRLAYRRGHVVPRRRTGTARAAAVTLST